MITGTSLPGVLGFHEEIRILAGPTQNVSPMDATGRNLTENVLLTPPFCPGLPLSRVQPSRRDLGAVLCHPTL